LVFSQAALCCSSSPEDSLGRFGANRRAGKIRRRPIGAHTASAIPLTAARLIKPDPRNDQCRFRRSGIDFVAGRTQSTRQAVIASEAKQSSLSAQAHHQPARLGLKPRHPAPPLDCFASLPMTVNRMLA
jgi:hypothetical protein